MEAVMYGTQPKLNPFVRLILLMFDGIEAVQRLLNNTSVIMTMLCLFGLGVLGRDIWMLSHHMRYDGVPFVLALGCFALAGIVWGIQRSDEIGS